MPDEIWLSSLDERKRRELEFHDRDRDRTAESELDQDTYEKFYGNRKYYSATADSRSYVNDWISSNAKGRVFLDYACGNGAQAILAAKSGAALAIGIDISAVSVENATADAHEAGVSENARFIQADAERTLLPDSSIDVVICSGMLHHLDLSFAFPELRRILKPGGKILAVEALDYNPAIKAYRKLTPQMRTEWEKAHILSFKDVRFARRFFEVGEVRYWHLLGILSPHVPALAGFLERADRRLSKIPLFQRMAWIFTFELIKPVAAEGQVPIAPMVK
ncbi:Methyltransferase type 11 [Nocardioides sp. JS614]|nr:Methyltransferase type 11 [Nocardioides sp. JS614]